MVLPGQVLVFVTVGLGLAVVATWVASFFTLKQGARTSSDWVPCRTYLETAVPPKPFRERGSR
jgi:hypothetical protein